MDTETGCIALAIGRALAKRRVARTLTQEQVTEHLNVGVEAVSCIERGVVIQTIARLISFAHIFACNAADLLTESSPRSNDQAAYLNSLLSQVYVDHHA